MINERCETTIHTASNRVAGGHLRIRTLYLFLIALCWLLGPSAGGVLGQATDPLEAIGIAPFNVQLPVEQGYVNAGNGDLHLKIPLGSYAQRGGTHVNIALEYDSAFWDQSSGWWPVNDAFYPSYRPDLFHGWNLTVSTYPGGTDFNWQDHYICSKDGNPDWTTYNQWTYTDPYGTVHAFGIQTTQGWINQCGNYTNRNVLSADGFAKDGSGYHMYITNATSAVVYAPDGSTDTLPYTYGASEDANGNYVVNDPVGSQFVDTLKRTLVTRTANGTVIAYALPNEKGGTSTFTLTKKSINVSTNFASVGSPWTEWSGALTVIQSLQLPDNTSYTFKYDCDSTTGNSACGSPHGQAGYYGQLISMTLPTGTQITYSYANFADSLYLNSSGKHITRGIGSRTTPDGTWTYAAAVITQCTAPGQVCKQQLTVTKPPYSGRSDNQVYKFNVSVSLGAYPYEADYYNGAVSPANLLLTQLQSWYVYHLISSTTILPVPGGVINRTVQSCPDMTGNNGINGNLLSKWEWEFYTGTVLSDPTITNNSCTLSATTPPDRTTTFTYLNGASYLAKNIVNKPVTVKVTNSSGSTVSQTNYSYDGSSLISGAVGSCPVVTGSQYHDDTNYGTGNTVRGNATQIQQLISGSNYLTTSRTFDITGQLRSSTDSNGNVKTYCYSDNFFTDVGDSSNPTTYSPSTPTDAYLTTITHTAVNSVTLTENLGYYWGTGQTALSTDPNNQSTYFHFYDSLKRPTSTKLPPVNGGSNSGWIYNVYNSSETQVDTGTGITITSLSTSCTGSAGDCRHAQKQLDGLGRVTNQILVSDPDGQATVSTVYDSDGRVYSVSNPHRSTSLPTDGTESYAYDGLDRKIQTTRADGSVAHTYYGAAVGSNGGLSSQSCSGYGIGYPVLTVDEASKKRQSWTDGFGRLIEVDEPDPSSGNLSSGLATCYSYDLNNNLTGVTQGIQTRSFSYDMLSRLTSATNPESGTINYYYTTSGGSLCSGDPLAVCRRVDARSVTTTYAYDAMNRVISTSYSDPTPSVTYGYDAVAASGCTPPSLTITNGKGHRTSMCDGAGATSWSFDAAGNILTEKRSTNGVTNAITYTYNLDSSAATVTYPSGRTITYAPGGAQRSLSGKDTTNSINYATGATYAPQGALNSILDGANLVSTMSYNSRLQPCRISIKSSGTPPTSCTDSSHPGNVMDLAYNFSSGTSDNGNVIGITNNVDGTRSQSFTYDSLNRISTAAASTYATSPSHCWGETFTLDRYGNLTGIGSISSNYNGCVQESLSITVSTSTNRISTSGFTYDSSGNLIGDGIISPSYDAENRIKSIAGVTYYYDGDGQRVRKSSGTIYWYGVSPDPLVETDGAGTLVKEYIFFGGKRIASRDSSGNVSYYMADYLGSARVVTNALGTVQDDSDFYPYGGERAISSSSGNRYKFEGKERDSESTLDDFGARFYVSRYGRFMTPDWAAKATAVPYAVFGNPQTLNLYAFVRDNPESYADLDGHQCAGIAEGPVMDCTDPGDPRDNPSFLDAKKIVPTVTVTYVSGDNPLPGSNTPTATSGGPITFAVALSPAFPEGDGTVQANLQFGDGRHAKGEVEFTSNETQAVGSTMNRGTPGEETHSTFTATIVPFEPKNDLGGSGPGKIVFTVTASDGTVAKGSANVRILPRAKIPLVNPSNPKEEVKSSPFRTTTMVVHY